MAYLQCLCALAAGFVFANAHSGSVIRKEMKSDGRVVDSLEQLHSLDLRIKKDQHLTGYFTTKDDLGLHFDVQMDKGLLLFDRDMNLLVNTSAYARELSAASLGELLANDRERLVISPVPAIAGHFSKAIAEHFARQDHPLVFALHRAMIGLAGLHQSTKEQIFSEQDGNCPKKFCSSGVSHQCSTDADAMNECTGAGRFPKSCPECGCNSGVLTRQRVGGGDNAPVMSNKQYFSSPQNCKAGAAVCCNGQCGPSKPNCPQHDCWDWVCGGCGCYHGCQVHDTESCMYGALHQVMSMRDLNAYDFIGWSKSRFCASC